MNKPEPTVYVVDDDAAVRNSLVWLVSSVKIPAIAYGSADELLDSLSPGTTGCILIDVRMPGISGLQLQEILKERAPGLAVIIVTAHADVPMAIRAMKAGAVDFIEKPFNDQHVIELISKAMEKSADAYRKADLTGEIRDRFKTLTSRETQVFERIITGRPNKVIAAELSLSEKTIEIHRAKAMRKMQAKTFADLVAMATRLQLDKETS